ncbi:MAG: hypothetical protein R3F50_08035 [Gammaproteobacteria bacterium]
MKKRTSAPAQGASKFDEFSDFSTSGDVIRDFAEAIARDIGAIIDPIPDGEIKRFDCPEGRPGNQACWYVLHLDGCPAGAYGSWRTGIRYTWRADGRLKLDRQKNAKITACIEAAKYQLELKEANP